MRLITRLYNLIRKRASAITPLIVCAGLFCYFSLHYSSGDHGLEARDRINVKVSSLRSELHALRKQKAYLEKRIALITGRDLNTDLADELARRNLEYADSDEFIIFE